MENLEKARKMITQAVSKGAELVVLPECFNRYSLCQLRSICSTYNTKLFRQNSEEIPPVLELPAINL